MALNYFVMRVFKEKISMAVLLKSLLTYKAQSVILIKINISIFLGVLEHYR